LWLEVGFLQFIKSEIIVTSVFSQRDSIPWSWPLARKKDSRFSWTLSISFPSFGPNSKKGQR
jgi:energy-converting hydrogenase Eha subunit A